MDGTDQLEVVLFSGGRGSGVLSKELIARPEIRLTIAINGYDDGLSTGEVRRLLGDCLGPSDFRKNASRMARALGSCPEELVGVLDRRLGDGATGEDAAACLAGLDDAPARRLGERLRRFEEEREAVGHAFPYDDCSVGNLVFAGGFLLVGRDFNRAVDDYCALLGLAPGLVDNVTDGTNAYLVAVDCAGKLLAGEAEIVDAEEPSYVDDLFLIDHLPSGDEVRSLDGESERLGRFLEEHRCEVRPNPRLLERLAAADLVIYAPGTQHSSLFPSYLTPGLGPAIAGNWKAIKVLVTNLRQDAEIPDASALDIVGKALYYLREKDRHALPSPCLVTHYLMHDPGRAESGVPYVPLGRVRTVDDPRLVRIGNFEDGVTGRHDAEKVLTPFVSSFFEKRREPTAAVLLLEGRSADKVAQSVLEALRSGLGELAFRITFFHTADSDLDLALPVEIEHVAEGSSLLNAALGRPFDYTVLFESSGMYRGDEIVNVLSLLGTGRLDAVWGSRRLSVRDIRASYRQRYRRHPLLGAASYFGSHLLSLAYLVLYGRYVSDTLSGVRAVRTRYLDAGLDLADVTLNQRILSRILTGRRELIETPVQFLPMSPEQVRRFGVLDGLRSLATILRRRL